VVANIEDTVDRYCAEVESYMLETFCPKVCDAIETVYPNAGTALKNRILDKYYERNINPFRTLEEKRFSR
jgi:hypothetical protein